jgi:hypothetical protein
MTLRSPSEKLESNAIKKFKTGKLLPNWPHLAATALARSGRNSNGSMWPQIHIYKVVNQNGSDIYLKLTVIEDVLIVSFKEL